MKPLLIRGTALRLPLLANSIDCVVTSPPYFGLRDYGHIDQLGLEPTPDAYVARLVRVFRQVRRVLKDRETVWLVLGDSYAGSGKGGNPDAGKQATNRGSQSIGVLYGTGQSARDAAVTNVTRRTWQINAKSKDLLMIPARVAIALRDDGWYLRAEIVWAKPNPMPESVRDRPTRSHECVFLLAKSERYAYDATAIAEPSVYPKGYVVTGSLARFGRSETLISANAHRGKTTPIVSGTRNKRDVWIAVPQPFRGAHFATFPEALVTPCILAGCPPHGVVLDPFGGSGTVAVVAERLGRRAVSLDLTYHDLARQRLARARRGTR